MLIENCGRKKLTKEEELGLKACYKDYLQESYNKMSFEDFKTLLLNGHWEEEIAFMENMSGNKRT